MKITQDMTFESLERIPEIREAGPYLIGGDGQYYHMVKKLPLEEGTVLGWNAPSMIEGVEYLSKEPGRENIFTGCIRRRNRRKNRKRQR